MATNPPDLSQMMSQPGAAAPPPDMTPSAPQMPTLAPPAPAQPSSPAPPASASPPSPRPILLDLIKGLIHPQAQNLAAARPTSRVDVLENFLGNFMTALGQGFSVARGPGAGLRGAGAAIAAPYQQSLERFGMQQQAQQQAAQIQQEQAKTQQTEAQTQQMGQMVTLPNGMTVPFQLAQKMAPALFGAQAKVQAAQIGGDTRVQAANIGGQARVQAAQIGQGMVVDVPKDLQDQFGVGPKLPIAQLNKLESAANKPLTIAQGANGPSIVNKQTGKTQNLKLGAPAMAKPVQVADPTLPGGVRWLPVGEAVRQGIQSSASSAVKIPEAVLKDFTSGASAKTLNSFNTAADHLKILSDLGDALDNGSVPLINRYGNKFATATGGAAPTTFNMAKQAVAGEIAKTFKGQATEGEISAINSTLDAAQSPQQLKGAINTALTLMNSKREALMKQYDQGIKAQPAFPQPKKASSVDSLVNKYGGR